MLRTGPTVVVSPLIALQDDQLAHVRLLSALQLLAVLVVVGVIAWRAFSAPGSGQGCRQTLQTGD